MVRRNIFQPPAPPDDVAVAEASEAPAKPRFPETGTMSGVRSTLRDLSNNAVREIDPSLIDDGGLKDRLAFADEDVAQLAASIRAHGQQVPIMVRPIPEKPGHYQIVYGRRRLRALRSLDMAAKALIRSLSDEQALLAQGQENAQRLDPSFVEKALFASELAAAGYETRVIMDALAIDKPMLSRMGKVVRSIPAPVVQRIGPAHGIGRRRWEELADLVRNHAVNLEAVIESLGPNFEAQPSDQRFARLAEAAAAKVRQAKAKGAPEARDLTVSHEDGTRIAEMRETPRAVTIKLTKADAPEFSRWMVEQAEMELMRLYEAWRAVNDRSGTG